MDIIKVIKERRSIRKYKKDAVPDEIVADIIDAARVAPSWANTQVCQYIVIKNQKIKELLSETLIPATNPARAAVVDAPVIICLFAKRGVSGFYKGTPSTDKEGYWFMFDAGIAMEHIVLAAWSFGLGTVHVGNFDAKKAEGVLNIPEGFSMVGITPLGYFDEIPKQPSRKKLEEITHLDSFGQPFLKS
ncbi:MAG TPA: nitroreductase family protein [Syntrophorhabdus sp.]|jgi:nitroreductase|nr:nitroreductase family protein [Syntrophorhabdus sp.]MDI9557481.1 nitroreductase family protein [Pseudomonadota bacterium]OQB77238.1 MAG: NADH dehydrogenase [Deltaproteobacteria bacterium ADurb.Bin135]MBP8744266.1 nitroreductase family protein [Syntrophorhabdus sp.]HNQ45672.1 nitroreductase family protein [Syntrophorhabdus sp.]